MSFIPKLQTALTVVFLLTTAGAISAVAQTPDTAGHSTIKLSANAVATTDLDNETGKPSAVPAEDTVAEKTAAVSLDARTKDPFEEFAAAPTAPAKSAIVTGTKAPRSPQATDPDKWHFQVTPYFWLLGLHGTAGVGNRSAGVDMSFGDAFSSLKFIATGTFEARKGKLVVLVDTNYARLEDDGATPGPFFSNATVNFRQFFFDPEVGYRVYDDPDKGASIDVLGGIRVWHVSTELDFGAGILPAVTLDGSRNWVDAVVGLRGKTNVSEKVFVSGKFDLGGGGSKFSWQVFGGLGYNVKPNIALIGGYRVLDVNYDKNNFLYDLNQRGPIFGLGFKF